MSRGSPLFFSDEGRSWGSQDSFQDAMGTDPAELEANDPGARPAGHCTGCGSCADLLLLLLLEEQGVLDLREHCRVGPEPESTGPRVQEGCLYGLHCVTCVSSRSRSRTGPNSAGGSLDWIEEHEPRTRGSMWEAIQAVQPADMAAATQKHGEGVHLFPRKHEDPRVSETSKEAVKLCAGSSQF